MIKFILYYFYSQNQLLKILSFDLLSCLTEQETFLFIFGLLLILLLKSSKNIFLEYR
jgi:hypothetical protein